ncbi:MAG: hypothetical protein IJI41_03925 [Anaerolineaceae bacterium]|nr:hypothetical protein [Anaerolineaceae bacterium]
MKRHLLFPKICLMLLAICANTVFADYIGPNPDLRIYTEYTIEQVSIPGVYVQCVDDTASPARTLGQYCDISGSQTPNGMTPPSVTSCSSFAGANKSVRTDTSCEYNTSIGVNVQKQAGNATTSASTVCSGTTGADSWCGGNVTLTLTGTEPKPNNSLNGGEIVIAGDSQSKRGTQPYTFDVSKEGNHDVSYWVYSTVGDTSEKGQTHVKIDRTAPKAVCEVKSSPVYGEWYSGSVTIEASSIDAVSGVYENLFSSGGTTANNSITLSQTGKGIGVSLTAKDYAYNTDEVSCGSFSIDNTAPILDSFTVPDASPYGNGNLSFSVSGHDSESGVKSVVIIVDGEEHSTNGSQGTISVTFTKPGEHTVSYRIIDNVGLSAESSVFSFLIDIDPPDLIINDISHNGVSGLLVPGNTVSGFGTDPGSGFSRIFISFPGNNSFKTIDYSVITSAPPAESIVWSSVADFSVPSGKYNVSVKGTDKVGNESIVVSVPVTVDADAPVTNYTVNGNLSESGWYRGSVTVTAASTDRETGIMSESVILSCTPSISIAEGKSATIPSSYSGICSVTVKASDFADNMAESTVNDAVMIDNTAPTSSSFSPAEGSVNGNQVHACINGAKDQHSGLKSGYLRITGPEGEKKVTTEARDGDQVCFDVTFTTDGSYSLFFELEDKAGNKNGESAAVVITVDATGPEIHFTSVPASYKNRDAVVTYTGTGSDSVTGIGSTRYSVDGGETWENLELDEDGGFTITAAPYERMTVRVSMTDGAGNESLIESAPLVKVSDASAKLSVPAVTEANMLIQPAVVDMEGNVINDFSGIESARAFVYGGGYDHRNIEMSALNNYAFRWDGTFPKDEIRETEDGETVIIEGSVETPAGWYWLTIEVTDVDGNISCYNTRIHAGDSAPQAEPEKAPEFTTFDISGKVNGMDSVSVTVSGTRYMLADFSRIEAGIGENNRVIGKGRAYTKENVLVVETLQAVKETLTPFSGLVDDLGSDYVIIDGHALVVDSETQCYCEDIRTGDYVSGLYRTENGTMVVTEFGPLSCERSGIERTDTGIVGNK